MKKLFKAIIGVGAVYGLCRASFVSGVGAGLGGGAVLVKEILEVTGDSVSVEDLTNDDKPKSFDQAIMQLWYNGTIKTICKEAEG